jgi:type IV pilus assembly protein PilW
MKKQTGLSLVELMVAMVLGLLVVAAVIELFISSRQLYRTQDVKARMQEDGRYAIFHIGEFLSRAGYRGCNSLSTQKAADDDDFTTGEAQGGRVMENMLTTDTSYFWSMDEPVSGHESAGNNWAPAKPGDLTDAIPGSDILTIRTVGAAYIPILSQQSDHFEIGADNGLDDCDPGSEPTCSNIVMVSNCDFTTVFQVSNDPSSGDLYYAPNVGSPGNKNEPLEGIYGPNSWVNTIASHSFYIRNNADGMPSLYQKTNDSPVQALLEGVEQMQVSYGVDSNGDLSVDSYENANNVGFWSDVISVRISLVMINLDGNNTDTNLALGDGSYFLDGVEVTPDDGRLRRVYTQTIMLKNRSS